MSTADLFGGPGNDAPLAARMRPTTLADVLGQEQLLGPSGSLRGWLASGRLPSLLLWGPPGTGKTTIARLLAGELRAELVELSAVTAGVRDVRDAVVAARARRAQGKATVLFIDEVHRFNKAQQDALLPHVEDGTVTLIGATTENPAFEVNRALLSRVKLLRLEPLDNAALQVLLDRACAQFSPQLQLDVAARELLCQAAEGDGRRLLNHLEALGGMSRVGHDGDDRRRDGRDAVDDQTNLQNAITREDVVAVLTAEPRHFDKRGDVYFDQISALHKAVRGSSPDAALYWLARMLDGGCDPLYLARRLVRMACEDIGAAEPAALRWCLDAWDTVERLGSPEGELALVRAVVLLAGAPKSNALYTAFAQVRERIVATGSLGVPAHLRNAPTALARELGHGADYRYAHDSPDAFVPGESYLPPALADDVYYQPTGRGFEARLAERIAGWREANAASTWQRWPRT